MAKTKFPDHLLGLRDLDVSFINEILKETKNYKKKLLEKTQIEKTLSDKNVINIFFENSTRTITSFELAEKISGANVINFISNVSSLNKGESFLDTIKNINALEFDFIVIRHYQSGIPHLLQKYCSSKIINAGDGTNEHPTQGLLDIFTLKDHFGDLKNLRVCIAGNISHSRVALSNIFGLKKLGAEVSVCGPVSFIPKQIEELGVKVFNNLDAAIKYNDAINILRVQLERNAGYLLSSLNEYNKFYGITSQRIKSNPDILILHPGPMNMNVEIDYESSISKNSMIFDQVKNGLAVKLAVFKLMNC